MASCDDDFPLLADDVQSQDRSLQQVAPFGHPGAHRYMTKGVPIPLLSRPHHQIAAVVAAAGGSGKKGIGGGDAGDPEDHEDYREAFGQVVVSKCSTVAPVFHDHHHCFTANEANPYGPQHPGGAPGEEEEEDEEDPENNLDGKSRGAAATSASLHHHHSNPPKRRDRDDLSDGESPYCYDSSGPAATGKRSKQMSTGDYRKDREEWSDTAIDSLLDVYTERYVQLNRGNLRGRDWEDVAIIVSKRSDKQKAAKSVEQCKNKIDNLKKRYKVEFQRLSSSGLQTSHWPWFKKMEQIVGSTSSTKAAQEEEKSVTLGGTAAAVVRQMKRFSGASSSPPTLSNNSKVKSLQNSRWKRVVLRISGAALTGSGSQNVDPKVFMQISKEIAMANRSGLEVAVVIGGRNFFCGDSWVAETGIDRATTYQIGMMASVMNAMMLQASLEKYGVEARIQSTLMMQEIAEPYIRRRAIRHLEKGRVVIFGGAGAGTGNPLFSTDTTAALRASEIHAEAVLKGTTANCVYNSRIRNSNLGAFEHISYSELVSRGFTAMDMTALRLCEENNIPVVLFNISEPGSVSKALSGEQLGILIDHLGRIS